VNVVNDLGHFSVVFYSREGICSSMSSLLSLLCALMLWCCHVAAHRRDGLGVYGDACMSSEQYQGMNGKGLLPVAW